MVPPDMATTTSGNPSSTPALPSIAEHDKLGPLGSKTTVLESDSELRRALIAEFQSAAQAAREASANVDHDVEEAVHDYRKALRRARAVLTLVAKALPRSERRAVKKALQEARRSLGNARDHAVAPETLASLPLSDEERTIAKAVLDAAAEAQPARQEIKQGLAEGAARALAQVEALEAALPASLPWATVVRGIRATYDEARCARKAAKRSVRSFHRWRRRSKELGYQLDVIAGFAGLRVAEIQKEIEGATDPQSPVVDLIMLRDFVETHGARSEALERLTDAIDVQLDDLMGDARRAGREAFRRKPRKFGKRLTRAVERDLAPVVDDVVS
jgi:CHAD domain-containing protein